MAGIAIDFKILYYVTLPLYPPPFDKGGGRIWKRGYAPLRLPYEFMRKIIALEKRTQTSLMLSSITSDFLQRSERETLVTSIATTAA
jgi:hypothetical protein